MADILLYNKNMEEYRTFKLKNKDIHFRILAPNKKYNNNYMIVATHNRKQVGYCSFCFENGDCKLSRIAVTNKKYLGMGIGSVMFLCMECFAKSNNITYITALFIPRGYPNAMLLASKFYRHHKMSTDLRDYFYMDREEISKKIEITTNKYEIPLIVNDELYEKAYNYNYVKNDMFSSKAQCDVDDFTKINLF